jgi:acyl carrier protein
MKQTHTEGQKDIRQKILRILADQLGVEPEDLNDEDSLRDDLRMSPSNLTDFVETLAEEGFDINKIDFEEMESLGDLINLMYQEEEL